MSKTKHTPLPWKTTKPGHGQKTKYLCVQIGPNENYSTLELEPEDAKFIVRAVNSHDALVAALEEARLTLALHANRDSQEEKAFNKIESALALAKGTDQ